jgi:hypothetical protein
MADQADSESDGDVDDASNVLVLGASAESGTGDACIDLLAGPTPGRPAVLAVLYGLSPGEFVARWSARRDTPPEDGGIVTVGDTEASVDGHAWTAHAVANPADLSSVGIELSDLLSSLNAPGEGGTAVCFDSLTALLDHTDLQQAFRFLHVVTGRVESAGAVGHYHVDPDAHDRQSLATLEGLFDAVVAVDENGDWSVER